MVNLKKNLLPRHVAIIMDGNGRWARNRGQPRQFGHQAGSKIARTIIEESAYNGIEVLTLFAFSSENWHRPFKETSYLMDLFMHALEKEVCTMEQMDIRLRIIGERNQLPGKLQQRIAEAEERTADKRSMVTQVALSYGGRWEIVEAAKRLAERIRDGDLSVNDIDEKRFSYELAFPDLPDVDLIIRTGGECRLSNFILWQAAYAELHFVDILWPDFNVEEYSKALLEFAGRQRRFGKTDE